ncbi:hypothetical protein KR044_001746 [Drosophila immigrans]|nr:hypothetical protein KR044_001746 [Drosophila immigrans]
MSSIKDLGKNPLDASCDASSVGWIVMQKRIYKERFPKTLDSFRSGFGTLYGEMFLGLERIHLITRSQGYLLYGYIEYLDGQFRHFFNEDFQIGDEHDDYDLSALGLFSGNLSIDSLGFSKFNKITLLNRKTSNWFDEGCSNILDAGWWFIYCLPE